MAVQGVTEPLEKIANDGDASGKEKRFLFAVCGRQARYQRDHCKRSHCRNGACVTGIFSSRYSVPAEHVVDNDVVLECGNHDEAIEDKKRGGAELPEGADFECSQNPEKIL